MNITNRITAMMEMERKLNRTEFKVLFALSTSSIQADISKISEKTGLGIGAVKSGLKGLVYHCVVVKSGEKYSYNDNRDEWKTELLLKRNISK